MIICDVCEETIEDDASIKNIVWPIKGATVLTLHVHAQCGHFLLKWVREEGIPKIKSYRAARKAEAARKKRGNSDGE